MKNQIENPISSPIEKHLVVQGVTVTFHKDNRFVIHTPTREKAFQIKQYLLDEGILELPE